MTTFRANLPPAPIGQAMTDKDGRLNSYWADYFSRLDDRVSFQVSPVPVSNLASPTELANYGFGKPSMLAIAYTQVDGVTDDFTLYCFDLKGGSQNLPYVVTGNGGVWVAVGGRYINETSVDDLWATSAAIDALSASSIVVEDFSITGLTPADRLLHSSATGHIGTVEDLTGYVAGKSNQVLSVDDGDGTIHLRFDDTVYMGSSAQIAAGSFTEFEPTGFMIASGSAVAYIDYNFGLGALGKGAAAPDLQLFGPSNVQQAYGFDGNATLEEVFGDVELNHDWAEGTNIQFHAHVVATTTNTGMVKFLTAYTITESGDTEPAVTITSGSVTFDGTQWKNYFLDMGTVTATGKKIGEQLNFRFYRDPSKDTYPDDAIVKTFGIHVKTNSLGSRGLTTK